MIFWVEYSWYFAAISDCMHFCSDQIKNDEKKNEDFEYTELDFLMPSYVQNLLAINGVRRISLRPSEGEIIVVKIPGFKWDNIRPAALRAIKEGVSPNEVLHGI